MRMGVWCLRTGCVILSRRDVVCPRAIENHPLWLGDLAAIASVVAFSGTSYFYDKKSFGAIGINPIAPPDEVDNANPFINLNTP